MDEEQLLQTPHKHDRRTNGTDLRSGKPGLPPQHHPGCSQRRALPEGVLQVRLRRDRALSDAFGAQQLNGEPTCE